MTDRATLEALLARVLEGEGPDRELDAEIVAAFTPGVVSLGDEIPDENWCNRLYRWEPPRVWRDSWLYVPEYTASLDAALTLVPEGWSWYAEMRHYLAPVGAAGSVWQAGQQRATFTADAATPARALIAACLKARIEA